jgi:hypothetical protein
LSTVGATFSVSLVGNPESIQFHLHLLKTGFHEFVLLLEDDEFLLRCLFLVFLFVYLFQKVCFVAQHQGILENLGDSRDTILLLYNF